MKCWNHAKEAIAICTQCGKGCCEECSYEVGDRKMILCPECKRRKEKKDKNGL